MIAYSIDAKPLAEKSIDKLVGCTALLISKDTYYRKRKCNKEYLSKIHERGWPYIIAPDVIRNEIVVEGALNPRYAVLENEGQIIVAGKKIIPLDDFFVIDGVSYSNVSWNKIVPIKPTRHTQKDYSIYNEYSKTLLTMGTSDFFPSEWTVWNEERKRWQYTSCQQEKINYKYPQMFITREGFLNWKIKPDFYSNRLSNGETIKADIKTICAWCNNELENIKNLIKQYNNIDEREEFEDFQIQMCAVWLLKETCINLARAHKKIDEANLSVIIDSIKVAPTYSIREIMTLPQYMHEYMDSVILFQ